MITETHNELHQYSVAKFSDCRKYRYWLERTWDAEVNDRATIAYLMLNPSTADAFKNDPTIERCQRRAIKAGFSRMIIVNLFPFRMTDSRLLKNYSMDELVGDHPAADEAIQLAILESGMTICGWGAHKTPEIKRRAEHVLESLVIEHQASKIHCLSLNADGSPKHPLYVGYNVEPKRMML